MRTGKPRISRLRTIMSDPKSKYDFEIGNLEDLRVAKPSVQLL